jgi:uncharacterized protein (TIGR00304 family)
VGSKRVYGESGALDGLREYLKPGISPYVDIKMEFTSGFLVIGFLMTLVGAILIYQSIKANPMEARSRVDGVVFIGPIPIIVGGTRKWIIAAIVTASVIMLWLVFNQFTSFTRWF